MMNHSPSRRRIVILGSGFGAVYAYRQLHRNLHGRLGEHELVIISQDNYFLFSPMLHEVATGGLNRHNIVQPIRHIMGCCLTAFYETAVRGIDFDTQRITTDAGVEGYDYLVVALGAATEYFATPGAAEHALALKTMSDAASIRNRALHLLERATDGLDATERQRALRWVVVGGGPTGVELVAELAELAASFAHTAPRFPLRDLHIELHQAGDCLLPTADKRMQQAALKRLQKKGIRVCLRSRITEVTADTVTATSTSAAPVGMVIWTAGVRAVQLDIAPAAAVNNRHRFPVSSTLQLPTHPNVFVVGDIADIPGVPQTAQAAVGQATVAGANLAALILGKPHRLKAYQYRERGFLVSIGQWFAVGTIGHIFIRGRVTWWLWRTVYLFKLIGVPNRIRVATDWTLNIFYPRDISHL